MSLFLAFLAVLLVAGAAGWLGFVRARRLRAGQRMHSLPVYHGAHAALWAAIEARYPDGANPTRDGLRKLFAVAWDAGYRAGQVADPPSTSGSYVVDQILGMMKRGSR